MQFLLKGKSIWIKEDCIIFCCAANDVLNILYFLSKVELIIDLYAIFWILILCLYLEFFKLKKLQILSLYTLEC
jgi:hypothetical protein